MAEAGEDTILLKKIGAIHAVNKEIIGRLRKAAQSQDGRVITTAWRITPTFTANARPLVALQTEELTASAHQILKAWKPSKEEFKNTPEMNFFNDNINYSVNTLEDLLRLNNLIHAVSTKYGWLDGRKTPPVLRAFLGNIEIVQKLLGAAESKLIDSPATGLAELQQEARSITKQAQEWLEKVRSWQAKNIGDVAEATEARPRVEDRPRPISMRTLLQAQKEATK